MTRMSCMRAKTNPLSFPKKLKDRVAQAETTGRLRCLHVENSEWGRTVASAGGRYVVRGRPDRWHSSGADARASASATPPTTSANRRCARRGRTRRSSIRRDMSFAARAEEAEELEGRRRLHGRRPCYKNQSGYFWSCGSNHDEDIFFFFFRSHFVLALCNN